MPGALEISPALMPEQFDETGLARLELTFAGRRLDIYVHNEGRKAPEAYHVAAAKLDGAQVPVIDGKAELSSEALAALDPGDLHKIDIHLE